MGKTPKKEGRDCKRQVKERDKKDHPFPDSASKIGLEVGHTVELEKPVASTLFSVAV